MSDTMTGSIRNEFSRDVEALKKDLANLKGDFANLANHFGVHAKERATAARDSVQESFKSSVSSAESCVRERPITSVLVAFGVGIVAAKLLAR